MNVLLSIHPKEAENILNGTKKFEYRKKIWNQTIDKFTSMLPRTPTQRQARRLWGGLLYVEDS